jgi:RNA polymerase sigma factor (TIGR02999 family)
MIGCQENGGRFAQEKQNKMTAIAASSTCFRLDDSVAGIRSIGCGFPEAALLFSKPKRPSIRMTDTKMIIEAIEKDEPKAAEQLLALVYEELRRVAAFQLASEVPGQTLQPTALVHEAWLRLVGDRDRTFQNRTHFFRAAAEAMRHILIDRARRKQTRRHGGDYARIDLDGIEPDMALPDCPDTFLALNEALEKYSREFPVQAELVKLKYFAGMTNEEASQVLSISVSTAKNYWNFSRVWLLNEIEKG